jgi:hypothetical protein
MYFRAKWGCHNSTLYFDECEYSTPFNISHTKTRSKYDSFTIDNRSSRSDGPSELFFPYTNGVVRSTGDASVDNIKWIKYWHKNETRINFLRKNFD